MGAILLGQQTEGVLGVVQEGRFVLQGGIHLLEDVDLDHDLVVHIHEQLDIHQSIFLLLLSVLAFPFLVVDVLLTLHNVF